MEIDLHRILRERMPKRISRWVPGPLISALERLIHQKELNELLREGSGCDDGSCNGAVGSEFASRIMRHLDVSVIVEGELPPVSQGERYMFASNHPLGGLDGIALISLIGKHYGDSNVRFLVNDLLMNLEPLRNVFLPINKFGSQGRDAARAISSAMTSGMQMVQFPAGLVSRLQPGGRIADLEWKKAFVAQAIEYHRDIVPIRFVGSNSMRFYKAAKWRKKLGIKVNLEQVLLPGEVCKSRGKQFRIIIGKPISWKRLRDSGLPARELAALLRSEVAGESAGEFFQPSSQPLVKSTSL